MSSFAIKHQEKDGCVLIDIHGYFAGDAGQELDTLVDGLLRAGKLGIVLDFTPCTVTSSPGIAALMEVVLKITEDFKGKVVLTGLDALKRNVFSMAGITSVAEEIDTRENGILKVKA